MPTVASMVIILGSLIFFWKDLKRASGYYHVSTVMHKISGTKPQFCLNENGLKKLISPGLVFDWMIDQFRPILASKVSKELLLMDL